MHAFALELLGSRGPFAVDSQQFRWRVLIAATAIPCLLYGAVCGAWSTRTLQILYSSVKVPLMLASTTALCLPSFFVLNSILGLRDDFDRAVRGILCAQATLGIALASLAPITALIYVSGCGYAGATLTNGAMFLAATALGQWTLARHYRPLIACDPRHRIALTGWLGLYAFVAIQLAWSLRPFIGDPAVNTTFFRPGSWTNAYIDAVAAMSMALGR